MTKNSMVMIVYWLLDRCRSLFIPATAARPRFVLSTSDMEYIHPRMGSSRRSILRLCSLSGFFLREEKGGNNTRASSPPPLSTLKERYGLGHH